MTTPDDELWEVDAEDAIREPIAPEPVELLPAPTALPEPVVVVPPPVAEELPPSPAQIIEAMLFVGGAPLTADRACEIIRGLSADQFRAAVDERNALYRRQNRPYTIAMTDLGYALAVKAKYRAVREKLVGSPREARLSQPALDVLSLVAYRQPITKAEVDTLRGGESGGLLRQLVRLGLIAVVRRGEAEQPGVCYGTTARFLELFHLRSLDDLPATGDAQRL